ncbi:hypothetical protein [Nocardia sp. NPDC002869]|uniref:hypothetical protein n=1 Tax=Nocardia sp. NPDC002869 TaxID=3161032 RepID=UPI00398C9F3E
MISPSGQRGYVQVEVDGRLWRSDYRVVPYVGRPGAPIRTRAPYVVEHGRPGAQADRDPGAALPEAAVPDPAPVAGAGR